MQKFNSKYFNFLIKKFLKIGTKFFFFFYKNAEFKKKKGLYKYKSSKYL
jgi:hypothetical protein